MSEIQAKLERLDSHALQSLETPALNFTSLSFSRANVACATRKKPCSGIKRTTCFVNRRRLSHVIRCKLCAYVDLRDATVWYIWNTIRPVHWSIDRLFSSSSIALGLVLCSQALIAGHVWLYTCSVPAMSLWTLDGDVFATFLVDCPNTRTLII